MRQRRLVLLQSAYEDLGKIDDWLSDVASAAVAERFVDRILSRLATFEYAGARGTIREDIPGLRVIGLLPHVNVAFVVDDESVLVYRILYGGQNWKQP
jgi:toxin ParE1/3/4